MNTRAVTLMLASTLACLTTMSMVGCNKSQEPKAAPPGSMAGVEVSDSDLTTQVKTALIRDETLKVFDIAVVTTKGDVRLTGVVDNQSQIDQADKLARSIDGVHAIHDELTIKK
jgi:hyperosmotically inducible protein